MSLEAWRAFKESGKWKSHEVQYGADSNVAIQYDIAMNIFSREIPAPFYDSARSGWVSSGQPTHAGRDFHHGNAIFSNAPYQGGQTAR